MSYSIKEILRRKPRQIEVIDVPLHEEKPKPREMFTYPFPLDNGKVICSMCMPKELSMDDARRICAFIMAIGQPE